MRADFRPVGLPTDPVQPVSKGHRKTPGTLGDTLRQAWLGGGDTVARSDGSSKPTVIVALPVEQTTADPGTSLKELQQAAAKGNWLGVPTHATFSVSLKVSQVGDNFQVQRVFRGCFGGSDDTIVIRPNDLKSGRLPANVQNILSELHEAISAPQTPLQPGTGQTRSQPIPPFPSPRLKPMDRPVGDQQERRPVADVPARRRDLEAGLQRGPMGSTGCTGGGMVSISRSGDGYKLTTHSGGFITYTKSVTISEADLQSGRLTEAQIGALDLLRDKLAETSQNVP